MYIYMKTYTNTLRLQPLTVKWQRIDIHVYIYKYISIYIHISLFISICMYTIFYRPQLLIVK